MHAAHSWCRHPTPSFYVCVSVGVFVHVCVFARVALIMSVRAVGVRVCAELVRSASQLPRSKNACVQMPWV